MRTVLRLLAAVTVGAVALAAPAVRGSAVVPQTPVIRSADTPAAAWTVMIYEVADTESIADEMLHNLVALAALPDMPNVNVVALVDLPDKDAPDYPTTTLPGVAPFSDTQLLVLKGQKWNVVRDEGEQSMGTPGVLSTFIQEAAADFPAQQYGLILSDHGSAWDGGYWDLGPPAPTHLSIADMHNGIVAGMQAAGISQLGFIDHDACLEAGYEVASALAPLTQFMAASEEETEGDDGITPEAIQALAAGGDGEQFADTNVDSYAQWVQDNDPDGAEPFTALSVIDSSKMPALDAAVASFASVAEQHMAEIAPELARARSQALEFAIGISGQGESFNSVDLGDFLAHLTDVPPDVAVARDAVITALKGVVQHLVTREGTQEALGLNVFFPGSDSSAQQEQQAYLGGQVGGPAWDGLVTAFAQQAASSGSSGSAPVGFTSQQAHLDGQDATGIRISAQLKDGQSADVADAHTDILTSIGGQQVIADELPAFVDAGQVGNVEGVWNYAMPALVDGSEQSYGTGLFKAQSGGLLGSFFAHYKGPDGNESDVQILMLLSSAGKIESYSAVDANGGLEAGVRIQLGGTLTPYLLTDEGNGDFGLKLSNHPMKVTNGLDVRFVKLKPATPFAIVLSAFDLAGNVDSSGVRATIPGSAP